MSRPLTLIAASALLAAAPASAVLVNIQSTLGVNVIDDNDNTIADNLGYVFLFGSFDNGFTPTDANQALWDDNWVTFTELDYTYDVDFDAYLIAGSAEVLAANPGDPSTGGWSSWYPVHDEGLIAGSTFDFSGQRGYLWVYNPSNTLQFLGSSTTWVFPDKFVPTGIPGDPCCDSRPPVDWSLTQIDEDPPVGDFPPGDPPETIKLIPEPSTALLAGIAALGALRRRRVG